MEVVRIGDAPTYTAPGHDEVTARRLQGGEASGAAFALMGYSQFPAGAKVQMDAGSTAKIYVVTEGVLTVRQADGVAHQLNVLDSIHIPAGEARSIENARDVPAAMIVIMPPANA